MSGLVVDASVVIAWLFDDEDEPRADNVLEHLAEEGALVPHLWHLETRNTLLIAERRGRLSAGAVNERMDALKGLPILTDEEPDLQSAFDLARAHKLSFYGRLIPRAGQEGERRARNVGRGTRSGCRRRRGAAISRLTAQADRVSAPIGYRKLSAMQERSGVYQHLPMTDTNR